MVRRCGATVQRHRGSVMRAMLTAHSWSPDPNGTCHGHAVAVSIIITMHHEPTQRTGPTRDHEKSIGKHDERTAAGSAAGPAASTVREWGTGHAGAVRCALEGVLLRHSLRLPRAVLS